MKNFGLINKNKFKMKNITLKALTFLALVVFGFSSCNDFEDENFDFSTSLPAYVELSSGSIADFADSTITVEARVRTALQSVITVDYDITGDFTESGTIEIPAGSVSGTTAITLPGNPDTGSATLTITGVDNGLSIGRGDASVGLSATEMQITWQPE